MFDMFRNDDCNRDVTCNYCGGSGKDLCTNCNGIGKINGKKCEKCDGTGKVTCKYCNGIGEVSTSGW